MVVILDFIIEHFNFIEYTCSRNNTIAMDFLSNPLLLETVEELPSHCIIIAITTATHAR